MPSSFLLRVFFWVAPQWHPHHQCTYTHTQIQSRHFTQEANGKINYQQAKALALHFCWRKRDAWGGWNEETWSRNGGKESKDNMGKDRVGLMERKRKWWKNEKNRRVKESKIGWRDYLEFIAGLWSACSSLFLHLTIFYHHRFLKWPMRLPHTHLLSQYTKLPYLGLITGCAWSCSSHIKPADSPCW